VRDEKWTNRGRVDRPKQRCTNEEKMRRMNGVLPCQHCASVHEDVSCISPCISGRPPATLRCKWRRTRPARGRLGSQPPRTGVEEVPNFQGAGAEPDAARLAVRSKADRLTARLRILNSPYSHRPTCRPNMTTSSSSSSCSLSSDGSLTSPSVTGTSARTNAPCRLCAWRRSNCWRRSPLDIL